MIDLFISLVESLSGIPAIAMGAALLLYALYRMARHEVLLFGSVTGVRDATSKGLSKGRYMYSFLVQNLEEVSFPGPFEVVLRDRRYSEESAGTFEVSVLAGPRHLVVWTSPDAEGKPPQEWHGRFEKLSPFDTWRFDVETSSKWVELEIDTGDENRTIFHRLIVDVSPRKIAVDAEHSKPQVFKGSATTPGIEILISIVVAALLTYVGTIKLVDQQSSLFGVSSFPFTRYDLYVIAVLITLLWLGYRRIQRPVYPIIQGYFLNTRVNKSHTPSSKNSKDAG